MIDTDDDELFRRMVVFEDANARLRSENERLARELDASASVPPTPLPSTQQDSTAIAFVLTIVLAIVAYIFRFCR